MNQGVDPPRRFENFHFELGQRLRHCVMLWLVNLLVISDIICKACAGVKLGYQIHCGQDRLVGIGRDRSVGIFVKEEDLLYHS